MSWFSFDRSSWAAWSSVASITPSRIALATMYSASCLSSSLSFSQMSAIEIRAYATLILRRPALMTLWRSRLISES